MSDGKTILVDVSRCTGCRGCQVACKQWNELPATDTVQTGSYQNPPDMNGDTYKIVRFREGRHENGKPYWNFFTDMCRHCVNPPCVLAADEGTMIHDEATGAVVYTEKTAENDFDVLLDACPYRIPRKNEKTGAIVKCTMCIDRISAGGIPACVQSCPTGAMRFGERAAMLELAHNRVEELKKEFPKAHAVDPDDVRVIYVITDDRLITNSKAVDFYVTFDLVRMGELQGQYIVDKLDLENQAGPFTLEIFSGSQDDTNAISFYQGAMNKLQPYLDNGKLVVKSGQSSYTETAIQSWDSSKAQSRMDNLLSGYYADSHLDAVLVAADCLALGVISSLESMGYGTDANPYPIVTGQDAELAAVKNILAGKQSMTAFLDANKLTEILVPVVDDLVAGKTLASDTTYNNGVFDVPTKTYDPYLIDKDNVNYLVDVGFYTDAEING